MVEFASVSSSFFFNEPATTEIYTYGHTLSLPDALPICDDTEVRFMDARAEKRQHRVRAAAIGAASFKICAPDNDWLCASSSANWRSRSEEHTSELQSLMRISYSVFCLKKKNELFITTLYQVYITE